jgi:hypothetical protein
VLHHRCKCVLLQPHPDTSMLFRSQFRSERVRGVNDTTTQGTQISRTTIPSVRLLEMTRNSASVCEYLLGIFFPPQVSAVNEELRHDRQRRLSVSVSLLRMGVLSRTTFLRDAFSPSRPVRILVGSSD